MHPTAGPLQSQLRKLQAYDRLVRDDPFATILRQQRKRSRRSRALVQPSARAPPCELLRGVNLPQIQHMPLQHAPTAHALVLHHAEIAVLLTVLLASAGAQKHLGTRLSAQIARPPEARSALQPLSPDSRPSRSTKPIGYTAGQSEKRSESAKSG